MMDPTIHFKYLVNGKQLEVIYKHAAAEEIMQKYMEPCFFTYIKFFDRFYMISTC